MSEMKIDESIENIEDRVNDDHFVDEPRNIKVDEKKALHIEVRSQHADNANVENKIPSHQDEEEIIKEKYGGLLAKKHPLISKDHERAFFDSADWALNKQGSQKSKGTLEALRPKLEPSPHQHSRTRSAYAHPDDTEVGDENNAEIFPEDQNSKVDATEVVQNNTSNHS